MKNLIKNKCYIENISYFNSIEKSLSYYSLKDYNLILCFQDIILNNYKSIYVFLKNIKTREILKCVSKIESNNLIIDLTTLNNLCTDHEFSIIIILEDYISNIVIYPKIKDPINIDNSIISSYNNSNIQWYLRVLENGKLRLSTIYIFSNLTKDIKEKIIL